MRIATASQRERARAESEFEWICLSGSSYDPPDEL